MPEIYLLLNGDINTPSTRLRWLNYISRFESAGFVVKTIRISSSLIGRHRQIHEIRKSSVVLVQKKLLTIPEILFLKLKAGYLLFDVDDAIWKTHPHKNNPILRKLKYIIKHIFLFQGLRVYDAVICANDFLSYDVKKVNPNVFVVPTSPSDIEEKVSPVELNQLRVVWTGTKANFFYLNNISSQLVNFLNSTPNAEFCVISDGHYELKGLERSSQLRNILWSLESESLWIQKSTIGIMPLTIDDWSKGKSAFKLIKYMKLHIPVLATDFGFQRDMIESGTNGWLIDNSNWFNKLKFLSDKEDLLRIVGEKGFDLYNGKYNPDLIFTLYLNIFSKYISDLNINK